MATTETSRLYFYDRGVALSRAERRNLVLRGPLKTFAWRALERQEGARGRHNISAIRVLLPIGPHQRTESGR